MEVVQGVTLKCTDKKSHKFFKIWLRKMLHIPIAEIKKKKKTTPMRTSKDYLFRVYYIARESATVICILAGTLRQAENEKSL